MSADFTSETHRRNVLESFPQGKFLAALAQELPLISQSFDEIFMLFVHMHLPIEEFPQVILELARVLSIGGKATIGPIPDVYSYAYYYGIKNNKVVMDLLERNKVEIRERAIPKEAYFIPTMQMPSVGIYGQRVYDVSGNNIELQK